MSFIKKNLDYIILGFIFVAFILAQINSFNTELSDAGDNAEYMILAKSIAQGQGYREINNPYMPQHTKFPPLFPGLLAPIIFFFGFNITVLKTFIIILSLITLYVIYLFTKEHTTKTTALAVTAMTAFSFQYLHWSHRIMAEIPLMLFMFLTLYFLKKENGWLVAIFTLLAIFTKSIGIILLPAIFVYLILTKKYNQAIIYLLVVGVPFGIWVFKTEQNRTYATQTYVDVVKYIDPDNPDLGNVNFEQFVGRVTRNSFNYLRNFSQFIFHYNEQTRLRYFWVDFIFMLPILLGIIYMLIQKDYLFPLVFSAFMSLLIIWPWETIRFVVPILPVIYIFFITGMVFIFETLKEHITLDIKYLFAGLLIVLILIQIPSFLLKIDMDRTFEHSPEVIRYKQMAIWASQNLNESQVTLVRKPSLFYIWSDGKLSMKYPYTTSKEIWMRSIVQSDYLLYDELSETTNLFLNPIIKELGFMFRPEFYINNTAMFRIDAAEAIIDETQ